MRKKRVAMRQGFTVVELMVATVIAAIVIGTVSFIAADSQRGWNMMYNRIYSDVVTDGYVARKAFDAVIRKASGEKFLVDTNGDWIEVYYYEDANSTYVDRYARFYESDGDLNVEYGQMDSDEVKATLSVENICQNVSNCVFKAAGRSAQMILTLDNGSQTATVMSCSVLHNE